MFREKINVVLYAASLSSCVFLFLGCVTASAVEMNVDLSDGVCRREAAIIAKNELLRLKLNDAVRKNPSKIYQSSEVEYSNMKIDSDIYQYDVFDNEGTAKFKDAWYVMFKPRLISISTGFLAIVDKKNGAVVSAQSGDFIEGSVVPLFEKKLQDHEKYLHAIIAFHEKNKRWPIQIDEIKGFLVNPDADIYNLVMTVENDKGITLFHKDALWTYVIKFSNNDYDVTFSAPPMTPDALRDSIGHMFDNIEFETQ